MAYCGVGDTFETYVWEIANGQVIRNGEAEKDVVVACGQTAPQVTHDDPDALNTA